MKFGEKYVLFCHVTTQVPGEKHGKLLQEKGGRGFPHIIFMDSGGNVLATHEDERSPEAFGKTGEKAARFLELKAKAEKGDPAVKVDFLIARLELGQLKAADAEKELAELKPSEEQKKRIQELLNDGAIQETMATVRDEKSLAAAGKKFFEMKQAGKAPGADSDSFPAFHDAIMKYAEGEKNVALFEESLKILKAKFSDNPRAMKYLKTREDALEKLKAGEKKEEKKDK